MSMGYRVLQAKCQMLEDRARQHSKVGQSEPWEGEERWSPVPASRSGGQETAIRRPGEDEVHASSFEGTLLCSCRL
jgi:hypothetical protein